MDKPRNIIAIAIIISILSFFLGIILGYLLYQYSFLAEYITNWWNKITFS